MENTMSVNASFKVKLLSDNAYLPERVDAYAGGYDLFMPEAGEVNSVDPTGTLVGLGIASEIPPGYVALIVPRSGAGAKKGASLNNTVGVIDSNYRGEWKVCIRTRNFGSMSWDRGSALFQALIVPVGNFDVQEVTELSDTDRGTNGFGSTNSY